MNERRYGVALFILRIALGVCFTVHGLQKTFGVDGGPGLTKFAASLDAMGVMAPTISAWAVALGELCSGIAMLLGCFHRIAAVIIFLIMAGAIRYVHGANGYAHQGGYEYHIALMVMATAIFIAGPGAFAYRVKVQRSTH